MIQVRQWKKNGRQGWEVDINVRMPDGFWFRERRKAPVAGKANATRWAQDREAHLLRNGIPQAEAEAPREVPTLRKFAPRFIEEYARAERQKPSSIDSKQVILNHHLLPRLGDKRLNEICQEDIQHLKADLKDKSPKTVNNVLSVLSKLLRVAQDWEVIKEMPCRVKLLRYQSPTMEFYDFGKFADLVAAAEKLDDRIKAIVLLGGDAGLRRGEIIGLQSSDVDFKRGSIHIQRSVWRGQESLPKGGRSRRVPLTVGLRKTLKELRHLKGPRLLYSDTRTRGLS